MTQPNSQAGFTLLELAVVVCIIGILAAVAIPELEKNFQNTRSSAVMNDLRVFAGAFQTYAQENGDWPPGGTAAGTVPPEHGDLSQQHQLEPGHPRRRPLPVGHP